ncbi:MAG: rod-binding protein [Novosphingobium sp.]|nr:rod-binding protein [Novosphingobium sp.]
MSPPISFSTIAPGAAVSSVGSPTGGAVAPKPAPNPSPSGAQAKLHATAQKFEAIFVRQMLASARSANMGDTIFKSQANDTFRQMQDERFADIAAARGSLGLATMIEKQLSAQVGLAPPTPPKGG